MTPSGTGVSPDSHRCFTAGQSSTTTCFSVVVDVVVSSPFLLEKICTRSGASFRFFTISTTDSLIHVSSLSCASKTAALSRPPPLLESSLFPNGSMLIRFSTTAPLAAAGAAEAIEILPFHAVERARLDTWMRESVVEIVKNLKEAPLLVQIFSKRKGEETTTSTTTEKQVVVDDWPAVKQRWESGETPVPEGVIFVEEIGGEDEAEDGGSDTERTTRAWGIVVQGKGVGCGPVCYLLKTIRVGSGPGSGMGLCSTHFCLVRVKSFRESVESQLKNCWLLQSQWQ
ncbi:hypothetical protein Ahy_B10g104119 isoform A [Arachis hypogaea]|uniref:DUF7804 domain-containing protein n=2 Tax=Arachis hypogaea TaxID=3818 RepID=A0A444X4S2_ARAHY|nr:hypothetical protein Ahy_B10g104119 isoform A [Arachis hypogaea]